MSANISRMAATWSSETAYERAWKCRVYLLMVGVLKEDENQEIGKRIESLCVKKHRKRGLRSKTPKETKEG